MALRVNEIVYLYWHPEQRSKPRNPHDGNDRNGFLYPLNLVMHGWKEHKVTGVYPDPVTLAKRIKPGFVADIDYFNELIERGKPSDPPDERPR